MFVYIHSFIHSFIRLFESDAASIKDITQNTTHTHTHPHTQGERDRQTEHTHIAVNKLIKQTVINKNFNHFISR